MANQNDKERTSESALINHIRLVQQQGGVHQTFLGFCQRVLLYPKQIKKKNTHTHMNLQLMSFAKLANTAMKKK